MWLATRPADVEKASLCIAKLPYPEDLVALRETCEVGADDRKLNRFSIISKIS
jgi:hypothetical protein